MAKQTATPPDSESSKSDQILKTVGRWLLIGLIIVVVALILAAFLPREWAQIVSGMINGNLLWGSALGLIFGFVFTALPALTLWSAWRARQKKGWMTFWLIATGVLALPNLMTLWIALGSSNSTHAGQRILDVDGPGFRAGSAFGAAIAGVLIIVILVRAITAANRKRAIEKEKARQGKVVSQMAAEAEAERAADTSTRTPRATSDDAEATPERPASE